MGVFGDPVGALKSERHSYFMGYPFMLSCLKINLMIGLTTLLQSSASALEAELYFGPPRATQGGVSIRSPQVPEQEAAPGDDDSSRVPPIASKSFIAPFIAQDEFDWPGDSISSLQASDIKKNYLEGVVKIRGSNWAGTGTFVSPDGHVLTNEHVIAPYKSDTSRGLKFILASGEVVEKFEVIVCDGPKERDLCLLKIDYRPNVWFKLRLGRPDRAEQLFAFGNPKKGDWDLKAGKFIALSETPSQHHKRWLISVPLLHGYSGGPVFTADGKLVCLSTEVGLPVHQVTSSGIVMRGAPSFYCVGSDLIAEVLGDRRVASR